jgi:pSer/pThr/pTyr-binding forkhead associated (FHA) protein
VRLRFRIRAAPSAEDRNVLDRVVDVEPAGDEIRIGRRAGLEIQLPFATVSGLHARIYRQGNEWGLLDMGSSNGTFVGQTRLPLGVPRVIKAGDVIKVADVSITFEGEVGASPPASTGSGPESTATLARRLVNDLFQSVGGAEMAKLLVASGPAAGQSLTLALPDRTYRVGRSPDCDLVLPDDDVSREHAAFEKRWQGVFVRDLGSKNGVQIQGEKIRGERRLRHGDLLLVGTTQLKVEDPEEKYLRDMDEKERSGPAAAPPAARGAGPVPAPAPPGGTAPARDQAPAARPAPAPAPAPPPKPAPPPEPEPPPPAKAAKPPVSDDDEPPPEDEEPGPDVKAAPASGAARAITLAVSAFALAVLAGVLYLAWVMFSGMSR